MRTFLSCLVFIALAISTNGQSSLTNGLVAYYQFNGNANDSVRARGGTVVSATLANDRFGSPSSAYFFNGANSYIRCPDVGLPAGNRARTLSFWMFARSYGVPTPTDPVIVCYGHGQPNDTFYAILFGASRPNSPIAVGRSGGGDGPLWAGIQLKQWYHVAITHDGKTTRLYVDGILRGATPRTYETLLDGNFYIGSYTLVFGPYPTFHGLIDEVRIYNRALTANETSQLFDYEREPASASQIATSIQTTSDAAKASAAILKAAAKMSPPTNTVIELMAGKGDVRVIDSKGVLVWTDSGKYAPRVPIADLTPTELFALLENRTAYSVLTSFGQSKNRTAQSEGFERRLHQIWTEGPSLTQKIQTRLEIVDAIKAYNMEVALLGSDLRSASQYAANAENAKVKMSVAAGSAQNAADRADLAAISDSRVTAYYAQKDAKAAEKRFDEAQRKTSAAAANAQISEQQMTGRANKVGQLAGKLASYGIDVPVQYPSFYPIPSLAMRLEVDIERVSK